MDKFLTNLKLQAEENPIAALAIAGVVLTAVGKFIGAGISVRNSHVWAKEVSRRAMKDAVRK